MIEELIAVLRENEKLKELSAEDFSDIFWLAIEQSRFSGLNKQEVPTITQTNDITPGKKNKSHTADNPQKKDSSPKPQESQPPSKTADVFVETASTHSQKSTGSGKLPIRLPDASALPNKLQLARSLKPLMRQIPSIYDVVLDEVATTERIAKEGIWLPVLKPAPELWLELDLVVDAGTSMLIWRNTILELRQLLENLGVFRNIRTWSLFTDNEGKVQIRPGIGSATLGKSNRNPRELVNPNGRSLIWVLSDCVSEMWRNGVKNGAQNDNIISALNIWANSSSLAIVQMLPQWLWTRIALGNRSIVELCAETPGVPNHQLQVRQLSLWDEINQNNQDVKVPVLTLKPEIVATWSQMVAGMGTVWASGVVFQLNTENLNTENLNTENSNNQKSDETPTELTSQQRFQRFRLTASPMARRLASLLAATPIVTLPVIRLIQKTMLPQSTQVHVAEVLLGGLVKLKTEIKTDTNPSEVEYQFIDDVNEILIDSLSTTEKLTVKFNLVEKLTEHIVDKIGLSIETFAGFLKDPRLNSFFTQQDNPIASIALEKLKQLGGKYAEFAALLEQIKTFTFETVTVNRQGEIINRETKQAQYFTENIKPPSPITSRGVGGEVIPLEMVYIPGGTFMMGTEDEEI
ncbi:MAG: SAV_2336 N-terminal domain-related protein, partial [Cyanobacteria bacterium J06635_10]